MFGMKYTPQTIAKIDGQLMHSRNPDSEELMWILLYADDIVTISKVCEH